MRFLYTLALSALCSLGNAAAIARDETPSEPQTDYDAIIVGGGPAGLSALSGLARVRVTPAYYRWAARKQLSYYDTVSMVNGTVTKIQPRENNTWFSLSVDYPNKETKTLTARKVVLATGLRDILPETPGIEENWGKGIFWCPWCDGHEHADQPLGLLASLDKVAGLVREMATLNKDIVAFVNGTDTDEYRALADKDLAKWEAYLRIHNVKVDNRTIKDIERLKEGANSHADPSLPSVAEYDWFHVNFAKGGPVGRAAFLASFPDSAPEGTPPKQLRGFEKVFLAAGQSQTVGFELMRRDLSYWDIVSQEWLIPEGEFVVSVGFSSRDLKEVTRITPVAA
ncbi:hypothetical protein NM208_g4201 [Fusarium decemcellulare]|uniref:Uncharacterized protein n=1 Tax=Fusarium decemcellulare TaxID=57161 RepID=A0ACC1SLW2_9HYPO|nr:hypothetical protein NM208_g4201 [Fusarium decemcellulare]